MLRRCAAPGAGFCVETCGEVGERLSSSSPPWAADRRGRGRAQGKVEQDDADGGSHAVHEGDTAGDLGQGLGYGVFLTEDVNVAEVAEERVGEDVQQQAGTGSQDDLDQVAGAVAVEIAELEHLVATAPQVMPMRNFSTKVVTA